MNRVVITAALALGFIASAAQAEEASCKKVRFADVGWTDIQVTTGTTQVILEALGYEPEVKTLCGPGDLRVDEEQGHRRVPRQLDAEHDRRHQGLHRR